MARVSTYLNFPNQTEAAFLFYRSVFNTGFGGQGIMRFGEMPAPEGTPPMSDAVKKLVIHVELPILGGHVLMGTDAPPEMGFALTAGDNVHINLEPDTRAETQRLFDALAEGGKVSQQLSEQFWGGFFGSLQDKFGIHWMFNCNARE
ncbi:MAG: VOC family protein [Saprospiraceae bacterium]|nr:VOC family protein [Saprospiraceae bacterium]MCB9320385.1 VOC family protein [Lewinellaceae bacterium]